VKQLRGLQQEHAQLKKLAAEGRVRGTDRNGLWRSAA